MKPCGTGIIHPGLSLRSQGYSTTVVPPKHTGIKDHSINLIDDKQPSYALSSCPPALRNYPSASKTIVLNCASEISKT